MSDPRRLTSSSSGEYQNSTPNNSPNSKQNPQYSVQASSSTPIPSTMSPMLPPETPFSNPIYQDLIRQSPRPESLMRSATRNTRENASMPRSYPIAYDHLRSAPTNPIGIRGSSPFRSSYPDELSSPYNSPTPAPRMSQGSLSGRDFRGSGSSTQSRPPFQLSSSPIPYESSPLETPGSMNSGSVANTGYDYDWTALGTFSGQAPRTNQNPILDQADPEDEEEGGMADEDESAGDQDWVIPLPVIQYTGNIPDIEAFRRAKYSRERIVNWDENNQQLVVRTRQQVLEIFNAILQTDDVEDGLTEKGEDAQAVRDIKNGRWDHDLLWKLSWKIVMDVYEVEAGADVGATVYIPRPTKRDPGRREQQYTIDKNEYPNFQARFNQVHRLHWQNKAHCKNVLDEQYSSRQWRGICAPETVTQNKKRQKAGNDKRRPGHPNQPKQKKAKTTAKTQKASRNTVAQRGRSTASQSTTARGGHGRLHESLEASTGSMASNGQMMHASLDAYQVNSNANAMDTFSGPMNTGIAHPSSNSMISASQMMFGPSYPHPVYPSLSGIDGFSGMMESAFTPGSGPSSRILPAQGHAVGFGLPNETGVQENEFPGLIENTDQQDPGFDFTFRNPIEDEMAMGQEQPVVDTSSQIEPLTILESQQYGQLLEDAPEFGTTAVGPLQAQDDEQGSSYLGIDDTWYGGGEEIPTSSGLNSDEEEMARLLSAYNRGE